MLCALDLPSLDSIKYVVTTDPTSKYFPHSLDSFWVYEDQDGNQFISRVVEGKEIDGKLYHAFNFASDKGDYLRDGLFLLPPVIRSY